MYRQYENPRTLEQELKEKRKQYEYLKKTGQLDVEEDIDFQLTIEDLEQRVNFAWQDEEYDNQFD